MGHRLTLSTAALAAIALAGACTHHGPSGDRAIVGVTQNVICGGAYLEGHDPCQPPVPASDSVTVMMEDMVIAHVTSAPDGTFRIPVRPGTYTVTASADPASRCDSQTVVVGGPPVPTRITITCTIFAP